MEELKQELEESVRRLDDEYSELRETARLRLGRLYNPADYPPSLAGMFRVRWDFPSIEPPDYLRQLHPDIYELECQRMLQRFDEAVQLADRVKGFPRPDFGFLQTLGV